jgi:transposase
MYARENQRQQDVFSYLSLEDRVPADHPLRAVRAIVDRVFQRMTKQFDGLYGSTGRPSIAPERLLRAAVADLVLDAKRTDAGRVVGLQPGVPLVRGAEH